MTEWTTKDEAPILPTQEYRANLGGMEAQLHDQGPGYCSWFVFAFLDDLSIMASGYAKSLDDAKAACERAAAKLASIGATGR